MSLLKTKGKQNRLSMGGRITIIDQTTGVIFRHIIQQYYGQAYPCVAVKMMMIITIVMMR